MNILAERSFPTFFKGSAPKLLKFYSDWLDWTEAPGNAQYKLNHLSTEQDIDESVESYKNHLRSKLLSGFPERTAIDLKLLLKNVLWLYRAKSSRKAYDFMFRVLFNSPATIWHPRDTMLKTSDGHWDVPHYVGIATKDGASNNWLIENCLGWRMTGKNTRAEGFVGAASSGYSGSIECRASSIKKLGRLAFYTSYGTENQKLLDYLGTIDCDPTLKAFRLESPEAHSEMITAVWTFNKKIQTTIFPIGATSVEIGTNSFAEPIVFIEGTNGTYESINLQAYENGAWNSLQIDSSNGLLQAYYLDEEGAECVAFRIAIEPSTGYVTFQQNLPIRKKGQGTSAGNLATFYIESTRYVAYGSETKTFVKSAELQLNSLNFDACHVIGKHFATKEELVADGISSIFLHSLFDWSDVVTENQQAEYSFEEPVAGISASVRYNFDEKCYEAFIDRPVEHDVECQCPIGSSVFTTRIPAGETSAVVEAILPDPIVVIGSKNIFGILVDNPTAHFAPGEKVRLLDPDTGTVSEIEPEIFWYAESEGHYTSSKGFLSDINAIQDNHYWQNYSYVVQSDVGIREWRHIVKNLLHPAGLEIFAEMMLEGPLEDGSGIYYLEAQTFLRKSLRFFHKLAGMAKLAVLKLEWTRCTSRLAQRHSITTDNWLYWMQELEDLKGELKDAQNELPGINEELDRIQSEIDALPAIEEATNEENAIRTELLTRRQEIQYSKEELEQRIHTLLSQLSVTWMNEDIRDWYDIRPSDVDENLNANSVLFFRNDGTLINPRIVEWVGFNFTADIDEPFLLHGELVSPHTTTITGTTLHPLHPMIHGRIFGNEYALEDGQEFIPTLYMAFVGSTQEASGVIVRKLISGNEILRYFDENRTDIHEPFLVKETDLQKLARKFLLTRQQETATVNANGIIPWKELYITDFIYVNTDGGLVFNAQSLLKIPDAWTEAVETPIEEIDPATGEMQTVGFDQRYVFERNAWNDEKISIVSYSPYDFSCRIWVERVNDAIQCSVTTYNSESSLPLPLVNSNVHVVEEMDPQVDLVHVEPSGWNGPSRNIYTTTKTWKLAFNDPERVSSWFNIQLPEIIDNDRILCFINGLLQPKSRIEGNVISIDTIKDNSSIIYSSNRWEFGELSLEEFVLDENGHQILDEDGNPETKLVMVSVNESDNVAFQETTLEDWLIIDESLSRMHLSDFTLQGILYNIVGCSISTAMAYAELYILAPIEGSRKLLYPWHGWKMEIGEDVDGNPLYVWPFTYDNARNFQYAAHNAFITDIKDAEINPDKQAIQPVIRWEVEYRNVSRLLNGFQRSTLISTTIASQRQSETVDRILNTWFNEDTATPRLRTDMFNNEHWMASANFSSTLLFNEEGLLIDPTEIDWSDDIAHEPQNPGFPQKWWSRPILAEIPVEFGTVIGGIVSSTRDSFKSERLMAFVDGLKIVDSNVQIEDLYYRFKPELEGKEVSIFSMGRDWTMEIDGQSGYFNAIKNGSFWTVTTKIDGSYVAVQNLETVNDIDLVEFVGLSMGRTLGTIWGQHASNIPCNSSNDPNAPFEIKGSTEVVSGNGDKRRFIDHTFLDIINVKEPLLTERLHLVKNNWIFGIVQRIIDVDPRFFMVFIDGRHSPLESGEWRYIKGTFFLNVEPQKSVEVYIGNPLSYLLPDFAKTAPGCMNHMVFNNLRTNIVPRHFTTLIDTKIFGLPLGMRRKHEIEWRRLVKTGISGYFRENWIKELQAVQKQSETMDDILYWKQMLPNAWLDVDDPMKMTNRSSMLVFDANGLLIDPVSIDWHKKTLVPYSYGNTVEIMTPDSILYTGTFYFPAWEYDETEGHVLHTALYVLDGKTEGRYKELVESNWNIVYIDNVPYNYDQWFQKQFADLHLEESVLVNDYKETTTEEYQLIKSGVDCLQIEDDEWYRMSEGENLFLTDELLDHVQDQEALNGTLYSFQIEAEHQVVRSIVVGSQNMDLAVEVPSIFGAIVFVDGRKVPEGSYRQRITVDNVQYREGTNLQPSDVPSGDDVQQWIVLDGAVYGDSTEHVVHVYWPAKEYGSSIRSGNLCNQLYANAENVHWEGIWKSACQETYNREELEAGLKKLIQNTKFLLAARTWLSTPNGRTFASLLGLPSSPSAAQLASAIANYKPRELPEVIRSLSEALDTDQLIDLYRVFASCIDFEAPLVEQFREYIHNRYLLFVDGMQVPVSVDSSGRIVLLINEKHVFAEDFAPQSFELYCIDLTNPALRSSTTKSSEDYQSLHFQNLRIFPYVESNTTMTDTKMYDWKIQYFIRGTDFKTDITIYMNLIGWYNSSKINSTTRVNLISETIDDVLKHQQMNPSAWSGLDFDILSKSSKSSAMLFSEDGTLIDPSDIDFADGTINPWQTGKVVEVLLPDDVVRMAKVYWPIYAVDPVEHSIPYSSTDRRFKELKETEYTIAVVDGLTFDVDRNLGKELQDIHNEESAWIFSRPDAEIDLGRYASFIENAGWNNSIPIVDNDAEHLLLTDVIAEEDKSVAGGSILGVSIDAEHPMYRSVQPVLSDGQFIVSVPRVNGEIVFVDGIKLPDNSFKRIVIINGSVFMSTFEEIDYNLIPAGDDIQYAIEILDSRWKDDDEHVVVVYWPNEGWASRIASPANLQRSISNAVESNWQEYGFENFKQYVQSRFVLFCNGTIANFSANADHEIFIGGVALNSYRCSSYELYIVDLSNTCCRTSESSYSETEQSFTIDNQQKNIFMESHHDNSFFGIQALDGQIIDSSSINERSSLLNMPPLEKENSFETENTYFVANNRDTLDNVFCRGSIPVRQYVNPSLYVYRISKIELFGLDDYNWKVLGDGEDVEELEFVAIDVVPTDDAWNPLDEESSVLINEDLEGPQFIDGKVYYRADYIPESWNFQLYATSRENPEWFYPSERMDSSQWMFYKGWNQRLMFTGIDPEKSIYIVEILDVSMENSIANTDRVYWLEKEFNKKSTLILDHDGLLEHPDGLEWCDGNHIFPHRDLWTAQAEEAEFPAIVNELIPDNIKKKQIMELCLEDMIGYDGQISLVADASLESAVAINARIYRISLWELLANKDYIFWEEGEFKNWIAWLEDDDVFDRYKCFFFINGLKIPDGMWTYDAEKNAIIAPLSGNQLIERLGFLKKKNIYDERIYVENVQVTLIDPYYRVVHEADYNVPVIVDANWIIWKDKDGFPVWSEQTEIDEETEVVVVKPDPREGIIWPISRIWKYFNSCTSEGIDVPEYYGYDLSKYVLAWVDGRYVQCRFDGTRIFVPGCETASTVEVYVFELHDGAWVERFNGLPDPFTLTSFRDMRVC